METLAWRVLSQAGLWRSAGHGVTGLDHLAASELLIRQNPDLDPEMIDILCRAAEAGRLTGQAELFAAERADKS